MEKNKINYTLLDEKINALEYFTYSNFDEQAEQIILNSKTEKVATKISSKYGDSKEKKELKILSLQIRLECFIEEYNTRLLELDIVYSFSINDYILFESQTEESQSLREVIFYKFLSYSIEKIKKISSIDNHSPIDLVVEFDTKLKDYESKFKEKYNRISEFSGGK